MFYSILFALAYFLEYRYFSGEIRGDISLKEALSSVIMAIAVFLISNISYVYPDTPFSSSLPGGLFYIRTLVDFSGLLILFFTTGQMAGIEYAKRNGGGKCNFA